jgi:cytochrome c peroxidase
MTARFGRLLAVVGVMLVLVVSVRAGSADRGARVVVDGLPVPDLSVRHEYVALDLPAHFQSRDGRDDRNGDRRGGGGHGSSVAGADNTPADNPVTNAGATLGRVLFYDVRLSANDTVACASCHQQAHGFSDPRPFSIGLSGEATARHSMSLSNARYYAGGRFF